MEKKQYETPRMDIILYDSDMKLLVDSVIYPGDENEPAG
jgi:hypothetical protein